MMDAQEEGFAANEWLTTVAKRKFRDVFSPPKQKKSGIDQSEILSTVKNSLNK